MARSVLTITEAADALLVFQSATTSEDITWNGVDITNGDLFRTLGNELIFFKWNEITRDANVTLVPRFSYEERGVERFAGISGSGPGTIVPAEGEVLLIEGASTPPHFYVIASISTFLFAGMRQVEWPDYIYIDYDMNAGDSADLEIAILRPKAGA